MLAPDPTIDLESSSDLFDGVAADADPARLPLLLRVVDGEPSVKDLAGVHPSEVLLGHLAPGPWAAVGVASAGWALPQERFAEADLERHTMRTRPATDPERIRVRWTVLVDRRGAIAGRLTVGDGETIAEAPTTGALVDVLKRVMGCPTAPPSVPTTELFAAIWLRDVIGLARSSGPLSWRKAAALHPAVRMLASAGAPRAGDDLGAAGRALGKVCGWSELRWQVIDRGWSGAGCSRSEALWFDDGSFARWAISSHPPLDVLVADIEGALTPSGVRRARAALRSWDLEV